MQARYYKHSLQFKQASGTSRGILTTKDSWFIELQEGGSKGLGECSLLAGLSYDYKPNFEQQLSNLCEAINSEKPLTELTEWPALEMGYETALLDLNQKNPYTLFPSNFSKGEDLIPINGLVWMGSFDFMNAQIKRLLDNGFNCIKLKIGALNFKNELELLDQIRKEYGPKDVVIRVDANGAFSPVDALEKLKRLSEFDIHSIEQPIAINQHKAMRALCDNSPLPIALDEELIGHFSKKDQENLIRNIKPQYLILKPSLIGGFKRSDQWIEIAESHGIGWWVTSALESNIGLNAIAQWTYKTNFRGNQGLGTGSLFSNNIASPLVIKRGCLWTDKLIPWGKLP